MISLVNVTSSISWSAWSMEGGTKTNKNSILASQRWWLSIYNILSNVTLVPCLFCSQGITDVRVLQRGERRDDFYVIKDPPLSFRYKDRSCGKAHFLHTHRSVRVQIQGMSADARRTPVRDSDVHLIGSLRKPWPETHKSEIKNSSPASKMFKER